MDNEDLESKIECLEDKIENLEEKIEDLEDDVSEKENEIYDLEDTIETLESELENGIEGKLIEIFQDYNSVWDDSVKDKKLMEKIMDIKRDLHY